MRNILGAVKKTNVEIKKELDRVNIVKFIEMASVKQLGERMMKGRKRKTKGQGK